MSSSKPPLYLLPVIVFAQFAGTSLWFAGNSVISGIREQTGSISIAYLTSIIQVGFICGTFVFALFTIADRYKATSVFFLSALVAATANLSVIWLANDGWSLALLRFTTGFFLAGIYPVGMKIAADLFPKKLGSALGYLVGALVLGTAFPYLLKYSFRDVPWQWVMVTTSAIAFIGGLSVFTLIRYSSPVKQPAVFRPKAILNLFKAADFRASAGGYFGHMWELYAFWAFVPFAIQLYNTTNGAALPVALYSFIIIASGAISCVFGGRLSKKWGSKKVAFTALLISGGCCLLSPIVFLVNPILFLTFMILWGGTVVADSPQFSSLVAQTADPLYKGSALTIVTSIGFAITITSIQLLQSFSSILGNYNFWILLPGPLLGLAAFRKLKES